MSRERDDIGPCVVTVLPGLATILKAHERCRLAQPGLRTHCPDEANPLEVDDELIFDRTP